MLTVQRWSRLVAPVVRETVDSVRLPHHLISGESGFDLMPWIDPWGDTVFNVAQCQALLPELHIAAERFGDPQLLAVAGLVERAVSVPHSFVVFLGD